MNHLCQATLPQRALLKLAGIAVVATASVALSQETTQDPPINVVPPKAKSIQEEVVDFKEPNLAKRPVVVPREVRPDRENIPNRPERPGGGSGVVPAGPLRDLVQDFQSAREAYMAEQRDLLNRIKEASSEERDAIRQQLKDKLEAWLQEQKDHIQTIRDQAKDMKNSLPGLRDVIDAAKEEGRTR